MRLVPRELKEPRFARGDALRGRPSRSSSASRARILTGVLLAFAAASATPPRSCHAGFTDRVPASLADPAATLPLAIFFQLGPRSPRCSSGLRFAAVLTLIILLISLRRGHGPEGNPACRQVKDGRRS